MGTWRKLIAARMNELNDSFENLVSSTLNDAEMDVEFDAGYGGSKGKPFTLWTKENVYFPIVYDGAEWVGSAPRNPNGHATEHMGG